MSEQRSFYTILGIDPYASANDIQAAYRLAKANRDLSTTEGYSEFKNKTEAFEELREMHRRAAYDAHYLPRRAEAILEVIRLQASVRLHGAEPPDKDGELTNTVEITFKRIAVEFGVTRDETKWISDEIKRQHPTETKEAADKMMMALSLDDIVMAIYAVRNNREMEQEREAVLAARKSPAFGFRAEAQNPGAKRQSALVLKHPMGYSEKTDATNRELAALVTDMLEHPKDINVLQRYKEAIDEGYFKPEWVIALAKANHTPHRIKNYTHEYRVVLGNIAAAIYQNPALAFAKVFTDSISKYVFDGLAYSTRTTEETQAFNLFAAVITINPDAFTYDEFERYCFRDNSPQGDGGMLVKQAMDVVEARPDLAPACFKGLVHKLYHHPAGVDPKGMLYTRLLDTLLDQGMVSHELLNGLEAANKRRDKTSEQVKHDKLKAIIDDARKCVVLRPIAVRHAGHTNPNDVCFID